jgi:hypothetical protein
MSSRGTGTDLSAEEANDLLHKLITESTKVQAAFAGVIPGLAFILTGVLKVTPDKGLVWVTAGGGPTGPHIAFDPSQAVIRKYADLRAFPQTTEAQSAAGAPRFASALVFVFGDTSQLSLFEIAA